MYIEGINCSCGVLSLSGLPRRDEGPKAWLQGFYKMLEVKQDFTIVFSDNDFYGNGERLENLIKKHKLGEVVSLDWDKNPNTGNNIKTWLWKLNCANIRKYLRSKTCLGG